jgi:hypothetical protein
MFPCEEWGAVPDVVVSALDSTRLLASWDSTREARVEGPTLRRPLLLEARAAGDAGVSFDTMDGRRSVFAFRLEPAQSWRLAWLLHDAEPRPIESPDLPGAIAVGGSIRVVTRVIDGAGAGLCGHPTARAETPSSLAITPVGYGPDDPGALANGVVRISGVAEGPAANLRLAIDALATDLTLAVVPPTAITVVRAEPAAPYDKNPREHMRGFSFLGTRVQWQVGGSEGKPAAWIIRLRAFAGDTEAGGAQLLVENLAPGSTTLVGPDGVPGDRIETREPVVGLVPLARAGGRATLRISAPGSAAPPLELSVDVPPAPAW